MTRTIETLIHELSESLTASLNYLAAARRLLATGRISDLSQLLGVVERAEQQNERAAQIIHRIRASIARDEGA